MGIEHVSPMLGAMTALKEPSESRVPQVDDAVVDVRKRAEKIQEVSYSLKDRLGRVMNTAALSYPSTRLGESDDPTLCELAREISSISVILDDVYSCLTTIQNSLEISS